MHRFLASLALAALFLVSPAHAADEDFNIWTGQFVTANVDEDWYVRGEAQERFTDDASRLGQLLLRSLIGYRVSDRVNFGAGYAYILTDPIGPVEINEHRIYQELNIRLIQTKGGLTLDSRSRLEQRFYEEDGEVGWRFRNFVQLRAPISEHNNFVAYTEPFIGLNEARFNPDGLAIWRNFAGVSVPIVEGAEIVPGYLNQYIFRDGRDEIDHIANLNLFVSF